jgi:hypothetical protein
MRRKRLERGDSITGAGKSVFLSKIFLLDLLINLKTSVC